MKINNLDKEINLFKKVKKITIADISKHTGVSAKTIQRIIDTSETKNLDLFVLIGKMLNQEYLVKNGSIEQINKIGNNSGTVQNIINQNGDCKAELEKAILLIDEQRKRLEDKEKIIKLLEKR